MLKLSTLTTKLIAGIYALTIACASPETTPNSVRVEQNNIENTQAKAVNQAVENKPREMKQAGAIEVFDGRVNDYQELGMASNNDFTFIQNTVQEKDEAIKNLFKDSEFDCQSKDMYLQGVGKGSFTKPGSSQIVYLYRKCLNDTMKYPSYISGIIIAEKGAVVSHFVYGDILSFTTLKVLPDINRNGLSEVVLSSSFGYADYTTSIDFYEFESGKSLSLGRTTVFTNISTATVDGGEEPEKNETAYKITVQAAKSLIFYRETYQRKPEEDRWTLKRESKEFSLQKWDTVEYGFKSLAN